MDRAKVNKVFVVGTVQEVDTTIRQTGDGRDYINGKIVIKVGEDDSANLVEMKVLAFAKTKNGDDNKIYQSFTKLDAYNGKRVKISGELRDGSMVRQDGSVIHFNEVYVKFVNNAKADDIDCATFEYSGFVVKGLYERKDKDDNLLGYRIEVAQANYNNTNMSVIRFDVHKDDLNIANVIESNYVVGSTVSFSGSISYTTHIQTKTEAVAFGDPIVKTYTAVDKVFRITGGNEPYGEEDPLAYPTAEIKALVEAYKKADQERIAKAATSEEATPATPQGQAVSKLTRATSLI